MMANLLKINDMEKKIVILSRVSTSAQSLDSQTNDLINEAKRLGYDEQHQIIIEDVESAIKNDEESRLGLTKLKNYINEDSSIDCVVCWEPSRLARRQEVLYSIRNFLVERKIQLIILNPYVKLLTDDRKNLDTTASIVFSLFATISENEMMIKKQRFMREKNRLRSENKKFAGAVIFGYMKNADKHCVPHPLYSKIIVEIFNYYVNSDASMYETYIWISGKYPEVFGALPYRKAQHKIKHLFEVDVYAKGNWCYPAILTQEVWDAAHEKSSKARCAARYNCKRDLLCRGKIYCGTCGNMMTGCGGRTNAYECTTDKTNHSIQVKLDVADYIIWEETKSAVRIDSLFSRNDKIYELKGTIRNKENNMDNFKKVIEEIDIKMNKLVDSYLNNVTPENIYKSKMEDYKIEKSNFEQKINNLTVEILSLKNILEETEKDVFSPKAINIDDVTDFNTKQEYVRKYINKMIVTKNPKNIKEFYFEFEYARPIITIKSRYKYVSKNQLGYVYRVNEDNTEDFLEVIGQLPDRDEQGNFIKTPIG